MLSLLNPSVILAILVALASAYGYGHHQAYVEQKREADRMAAVLVEQAAESKAKHSKEQQDAQKIINKLRDDVNSGTLRLSIPVSSSCSSSSGTPEARAELNPETSNSLISITEDGDKAIRDLNYCIDRYNQVKDIK